MYCAYEFSNDNGGAMNCDFAGFVGRNVSDLRRVLDTPTLDGERISSLVRRAERRTPFKRQARTWPADMARRIERAL